jgi:hypothetical protein
MQKDPPGLEMKKLNRVGGSVYVRSGFQISGSRVAPFDIFGPRPIETQGRGAGFYAILTCRRKLYAENTT